MPGLRVPFGGNRDGGGNTPSITHIIAPFLLSRSSRIGDFRGFRVAPGNPARLRRNSLATLSVFIGDSRDQPENGLLWARRLTNQFRGKLRERGEPGLYGEAPSALRTAPNNSGSFATLTAVRRAFLTDLFYCSVCWCLLHARPSRR